MAIMVAEVPRLLLSLQLHQGIKAGRYCSLCALRHRSARPLQPLQDMLSQGLSMNLVYRNRPCAKLYCSDLLLTSYDANCNPLSGSTL
jgi:hypothetical protein